MQSACCVSLHTSVTGTDARLAGRCIRLGSSASFLEPTLLRPENRHCLKKRERRESKNRNKFGPFFSLPFFLWGNFTLREGILQVFDDGVGDFFFPSLPQYTVEWTQQSAQAGQAGRVAGYRLMDCPGQAAVLGLRASHS